MFCLSIASTVLVPDSFYTSQAGGSRAPRIRTARTRAKQKSSIASGVEVAAKREHIHQMMLYGKYQHDGSLELSEIGDMSSVPALLRVEVQGGSLGKGGAEFD